MLRWFRRPSYDLLIETERITLGDSVRLEERFAAFTALFRHLILAAQKNSLFSLRPDIRVHGASVLRPLLDGREQRFLLDALVHAGATKVEFA